MPDRIKGKKVTLRPATLKDRKAVYNWSNHSDITPILNLAGAKVITFEEFCADWKEYYFSDDSPELGRVFIIAYQGSPIGCVAYNDIYPDHRVELDIWMSCEANCNQGFGPDAIRALCKYLAAEFGVKKFMMQPTARNPRAIAAYQKAGFVKRAATPEQIKAEWGNADADDSVLMIKEVL
jgi:diamine N-acetyltransferase